MRRLTPVALLETAILTRSLAVNLVAYPSCARKSASERVMRGSSASAAHSCRKLSFRVLAAKSRPRAAGPTFFGTADRAATSGSRSAGLRKLGCRGRPESSRDRRAAGAFATLDGRAPGGVGAGGRWLAGATGESLAQAAHLSTAPPPPEGDMTEGSQQTWFSIRDPSLQIGPLAAVDHAVESVHEVTCRPKVQLCDRDLRCGGGREAAGRDRPEVTNSPLGTHSETDQRLVTS